MLKKKMSSGILTPREEKNALKRDFQKRTAKLKETLPHNWKLLFMHDHKEYKEYGALLTDVMSCRSLHLETLVKIEKWAKTLN